MKFNQKTHKVDINTLNKEEAEAFIVFLISERARHEVEVDASLKIAGALDDEPLGKFWYSQALRHQDDVADIDELVGKVMELNI